MHRYTFFHFRLVFNLIIFLPLLIPIHVSAHTSTRINYNFNPSRKAFVSDRKGAEAPGINDKTGSRLLFHDVWNEEVFIFQQPLFLQKGFIPGFSSSCTKQPTVRGGNSPTDEEEKIVIDLQKKGASVSPSMYGVFFEEINHAGDGGLYAELVQNRSFEEAEVPNGFRVNGNRLTPPAIKDHLTGEVNQIEDKLRWNTAPVRAWSLQSRNPASASMKLSKDRPRFDTAPNNLEVTISDASQGVFLINEGYWGMGVEAGGKYNFRTIIRVSANYKGTIHARLLAGNGKVLASYPVTVSKLDEWNDVRGILTSKEKDPKAKLALVFDAPGKIWLDYVSLFPEATFKGRSNGLRKDLAQFIAELKPAFMRWPGGSVVGGITLDTRFDWKETLGDPAARPGEYFTWGYRCSYGLGYYEMLQFCEDIKADAMFVCSVGLADLFRTGEASPEDQIDFYIKDCFDAIEYALGGVNTTWGARRAADGHPAPFPLKYVEIGNEHWGKEYDRRFSIFYEAIKKRYPQLTLIYNDMYFNKDSLSSIKADVVDPHIYETPESFYRSNDLFNNHPRGKYEVYIGEYACNSGVGSGNMAAALSEAAFIAGMERNGDLVTMTSFAPLLENENDRRWPVNLIRFNSDKVMGRSSYYVQKMASLNRPTYNVWSNFAKSKTAPVAIKAGGVGFGSIASRVEFKDIKITEKGKPAKTGTLQADEVIGNWKTKDGVLSHSSNEKRARYLLKDIRSNDFTLECKARRFGGREGFLLYYGTDDKGTNGYMANIGGGTNLSTAVQRIENSSTVSTRVPQTLESNRWYSVKLVVTAYESKLYIDGKLLLTHRPETLPLQFLSSGYDESAGELVLKFVNGSENTYRAGIQLKGATEVQKAGKVTTLSATNDREENTFESPQKIFPADSVFNGFGKDFNYQFAPFSYTILRIKTKK